MRTFGSSVNSKTLFTIIAVFLSVTPSSPTSRKEIQIHCYNKQTIFHCYLNLGQGGYDLLYSYGETVKTIDVEVERNRVGRARLDHEPEDSSFKLWSLTANQTRDYGSAGPDLINFLSTHLEVCNLARMGRIAAYIVNTSCTSSFSSLTNFC